MPKQIDRTALAEALDELTELPFPGHPDDPDLAEWVLELAELDGHLAGLATTALSAARMRPLDSSDAAHHQERLGQLGAVGTDEAIYEESRDRIHKLVQIEDLLAGRGFTRGPKSSPRGPGDPM